MMRPVLLADLVAPWVTERLRIEMLVLAGSLVLAVALRRGPRRWPARFAAVGAPALAILGLVAGAESALVALAVFLGLGASIAIAGFALIASSRANGVIARWGLRLAAVAALASAAWGTAWTQKALGRWMDAERDAHRMSQTLQLTRRIVERETAYRKAHGTFASASQIGDDSVAVIADAAIATTTSWGLSVSSRQCDTACVSFAVDASERIRTATGRSARLDDPIATDDELMFIERLRQPRPPDL